MAKDFIAGGAGGLCLLAVGQPFDTIKVRMQVQPDVYTGGLQAARLTIAKEGPFALYKGVGAMIPGIAPVFALSFLGYEHGKKMFGDTSVFQLGAAGAFSAVYTTPLIGPGERIKCVAQVSKAKGSSLDVVKQLWKESGPKGLLRGSEMTLARDGFGGALYFGTYETLKRKFQARAGTDQLGMGPLLLSGGLAGWAMWSVVYPLDVIKSKIQTAPEGVKRSEVLKSIRSEIKVNGISTVYRGLFVVLLRAFPANAACFLGYEKTKQFLNKLW